ncbi:MAG: hypothetical protein HYZ53_10205 [Planctomycetes bacterium]|nr:hypothetical protein [Planctomycetota bacterium]
MPQHALIARAGDSPESAVRQGCGCLVLCGAGLFYLVGLVPMYAHPEALPFHIGCVLALSAAFRYRGRMPGTLTLGALLSALAVLSMIVGGIAHAERTTAVLRAETARLRDQRLGEKELAPDIDAAAGGDLTARSRLVVVVRERGRGWGYAVVAMVRACDPQERLAWEQEAAGREPWLHCGTPYCTLLGRDSLGAAKAVHTRELEAQAAAETLRPRALTAAERAGWGAAAAQPAGRASGS